ncbi:PRD domain-containing protein [Erysipelothrix urinaevulpis]|uniref:PRD domain-containing protein n=1 Tax=Erysipelothrix urinaevulpis TaxID=2683717 RepID=UPI00135863BD|nr:PRD domain-containing protein [Erysipelothrix urinaevulpis]
MYRIKKILNNNVVQATHNFQEYIVVGLGIGFNSKPLQQIPNEKIEKIFELKREDYYKSSQLIEEIPEDVFMKLYRLIKEESELLSLTLGSHAFLTIIDHINFAMQRHRDGQEIRNLLIYDLKILYPEEFRFSEKVFQRINKEFAINLPFDEVGFLTVHVVNGLNDNLNNQSTIVIDAVFDLLNIIRDTYLIALKPEELATQRIMVHLKMLLHRVVSKEQIDFDEIVLKNVMTDFPKAYGVANSIRLYIEKRFDTPLKSQEMVYLTIHIHRLELMSTSI